MYTCVPAFVVPLQIAGAPVPGTAYTPQQSVSPVCTTSNQMFIQEIALNVAEPI